MMRTLLPLCAIAMTPLLAGCGAESADATQVGPATYYVDATRGDDANSGLSPESPWRTLTQASTLQLQPGERLLLKCGETFEGRLEICGRGTADSLACVGSYGEGAMPVIVAPDSSLYAVRIYASDYLTCSGLELINHGSQDLPRRTGLRLESIDRGTSHQITLDGLYIHDVNGSLVKQQGGGSGILVTTSSQSRPGELPSNYDHLTIQNCHLQRCQRNAMIWEEQSDRSHWNPSLHTLVRGNLIEQVPGDGIVPIACDSCLVEWNVMRDCPATLPDTEAAAGFWPWSCDNTVIQFNEVSGHKAPWDGQGYDSDYNSRGTVIQYNYSHDNYGGLCLICTPAESDWNIGNHGSLVQYNVSINDGIRPQATPRGIFSPSVHFGGPSVSTRFEHNVIHQGVEQGAAADRRMVAMDSWEGYADSVLIAHNLFYAPLPSSFDQGRATRVTFRDNYLVGEFADAPEAVNEAASRYYLEQVVAVDPAGFGGIAPIMTHRDVCGYEGTFVDPSAIRQAFARFEQ